jgi:hypothetical protein
MGDGLQAVPAVARHRSLAAHSCGAARGRQPRVAVAGISAVATASPTLLLDLATLSPWALALFAGLLMLSSMGSQLAIRGQVGFVSSPSVVPLGM